MKNDNRIEGRVRPDKVEWAKKKLEAEFQGSDTAFIDWLISEAMQQDGKAADTTTSDGRYAIQEGKLYKIDRTLGRPVYTEYHPEEKITELASKARSDGWKRELAERKDAREQESHQADMLIKKVHIVKLQKRYAPETVPQRCKLPDCPVAGVVFANMDALNSHLKEYHHDRYTEGSKGITYSQGIWYQGGQPVLKWNGQPE